MDKLVYFAIRLFHERNDSNNCSTGETNVYFAQQCHQPIMSVQLDTDKLAAMVKSKRANRGLRAVAQEIGEVSASTLSRIEQGSVPDVNTFLQLCKWLNVPTDTFTTTDEGATASESDKIVAHLRADRVLPKATAQALIEMIQLAYRQVSQEAIGH
ncbi:helix-turn-helix domain-containing protein [Hymenobacter persicinus]|nr:helix-turn-helix transcriptional regulator [Hymenobacter persicinus]